MKRKAIGIILAAATVLSLAMPGCSSSGQETGKSSSAQAAGSQGGEGQKAEFTWVHHMEEDGKKNWVKYCADTYMKAHPNVKVNVEMIPNDNYLSMLKTRIASNNAPMIFDLDRVNTLDFQKADHLTDVSDTKGLKENFEKDILAQGQVEGTQYGVPLDISAYGVFYNKDIFQKYNLTVPKTADEFKKVCQTLKSNGVQPLGAAFSESWCQKHFCYAHLYINCVENNADWFSQKMSLKSTFASDSAFKKSITDMASYKEFWGKDPFSTSWNDVLNGIATGKIAMTINGSWTIAGILGINSKANIGTFAYPVSNNVAQTQIRYEPGNNFCIYKTTDAGKLAAAKDFFSFLCSTDSAKYYAKSANTLTACKVDVDMIPPINDIKAYTGKQVYNMIAVSEFNAEYLTSFNDVTTKALQKDKFDVDSYAKGLDGAFTAIK